MASNLSAVLRSGPIVWSALAAWLTGLVVAYEAARRAYEAQKTYASAKRSARHAMGLHTFGRYDRHILQISSHDSPEELIAESSRRQARGDAQWTRAHRIGLFSAACFIAGVLLVAWAVSRGQDTASKVTPQVAQANKAANLPGKPGEGCRPRKWAPVGPSREAALRR